MLGSEGSSPPLTGEDFVPGTQESGNLQSGTLPHVGTPALWGHHAGGQGVHYCRRVSAPLTQAALPFPSATALVTPKSLAQLSNANANLIIYLGFRFGDRLCLSKI